MERSLVKQGRNALTVTLPAAWLRAHGLKEKDSVHLSPKNNELLITTRPRAAAERITLDVRGRIQSIFWHTVLGAYIAGYDNITILHDHPQLALRLTKELIGMVIQENTNARTEIVSIISTPTDTFEVIYHRVLHMFSQQADQLRAVAEGKLSHEDYKAQERLLDANIYYCMRYLNKYHAQEKAYQYFLQLSVLEAAADQLSLIAKDLKKNHAIAELIAKNTSLYVTLLRKQDLVELILSLRSFRNSIEKKSFAEGLAYSYAEMLYNNAGYLLSKRR